MIDIISEATKKRYSNRYDELGYDVKTLGWGTKDQQEYRFSQTLTGHIDFTHKKILDLGCGFGDYFDFILQREIKLKGYTGYDINDDLIFEANKRHIDDLSLFEIKNILETDNQNIADIGVMLGLLNFNLEGKMNNIDYSKIFVEKAFSCVKELLIVDFLSTKLTDSYPKEDFVYYHNPMDMLEFAFSLSSNVLLKHDYAPIPQKEFMLFIYKD